MKVTSNELAKFAQTILYRSSLKTVLYTILYYTILYSTLLYILYYTILYSILYYTLYYTILYTLYSILYYGSLKVATLGPSPCSQLSGTGSGASQLPGTPPGPPPPDEEFAHSALGAVVGFEKGSIKHVYTYTYIRYVYIIYVYIWYIHIYICVCLHTAICICHVYALGWETLDLKPRRKLSPEGQTAHNEFRAEVKTTPPTRPL